LDYVSVAVVAALVTYSSTFIVRKGSQRLGFVVKPGGRMIHTQPTPTLGGVAMFVGFIVAMAVARLLPGLGGVFTGSSEPLGVALAGLVIVNEEQ